MAHPKVLGALALAALFTAAPAPAGAEGAAARERQARQALERSRELADLLARVGARYRAFRAFRVSFEQSFVSSAFGADEVETGTIHVQRPRRMLWLYDAPPGRRGVFDGSDWWLVEPEERQVTRHAAGESDLVVDLLTGRLEPGQAFAIDEDEDRLPADGGLRRLRLVPREPRDDLDAVLLTLDVPRLDLREVAVIDPLGSRWVYRFGPPEPVDPLPDSAFTVEIPAGWSIVRM